MRLFYPIIIALLLTLTPACRATPSTTTLPTPTSLATATPPTSPTPAQSPTPSKTPRPTITPASMAAPPPIVEQLSVEWTWWKKQNTRPPGEGCGSMLYAEDASGNRVISRYDLQGYAPRLNDTPLLVLCNPDDHNDSRLVDFTRNTSVSIEYTPAIYHSFYDVTLSPDQSQIAFYASSVTASDILTQSVTGLYVADVNTGAIEFLTALPPSSFDTMPYAWDYAVTRIWREDGMYYETYLSGTRMLWHASWQAGTIVSEEIFGGPFSATGVLEYDVYEYGFARAAPFIAYVKGTPAAGVPVELHILNTETGENRLIDDEYLYYNYAFSEDATTLWYRRSDLRDTTSPNPRLYEGVVAYDLNTGEAVLDTESEFAPQTALRAHNIFSIDDGDFPTVIYQPAP